MQRRVKHARPASPILFAMSRRNAARLVLRSFMSCASLPRFTSSYALWKTPSTCSSVSPRWAFTSTSWYVMVELPERAVPTWWPESSSSNPAQQNPRLRETAPSSARRRIQATDPRCTFVVKKKARRKVRRKRRPGRRFAKKKAAKRRPAKKKAAKRRPAKKKASIKRKHKQA
jgi:hypothetical protein